MSNPFDPALATKIATEMAEDDERCTGDRWGNDGIDVYTLTDSGHGFPFDRYPDSVDVIVGKCERCGERGGVLRADDEAAIVRMRNNARSAAEQLRAAVELLKPRGADGYANEDFRAVARNIAADSRWANRADSQRVAAWALQADDERRHLRSLLEEACDVSERMATVATNDIGRQWLKEQCVRITAIRAALAEKGK